jgi:hypothetical protein
MMLPYFSYEDFGKLFGISSFETGYEVGLLGKAIHYY